MENMKETTATYLAIDIETEHGRQQFMLHNAELEKGVQMRALEGFFKHLGVNGTESAFYGEGEKEGGEEEVVIPSPAPPEPMPFIIGKGQADIYSSGRIVPRTSRRLPFVDNMSRSTFPIEELVKPVHNPENIRLNERGIPLFSVGYQCPTCSHSGRRFSNADNKYAKCHQCETKMLIEPATFETEEHHDITVPKPDENGHFFIARDFFEVPEDAES